MKRRIRYSDHLKLRLALRRIPEALPRNVFRRAKQLYFDNSTKNWVAVARARYGGTMREMMVAFSEEDDEIMLITAHPLKPRQIANRVASGRWIHHERKKA